MRLIMGDVVLRQQRLRESKINKEGKKRFIPEGRNEEISSERSPGEKGREK